MLKLDMQMYGECQASCVDVDLCIDIDIYSEYCDLGLCIAF
jgi:hypothetical protein